VSLPRIELDLARPPRRWPASTLVLGLSGLLVALSAVLFIERDQARLRAADAGYEAARAQARAGSRSAPRPAAQEARAQRALEALQRELGTPWSRLLQALEASHGPDVALLNVEPDAARRALRLQLEARNRHAMLAYLEALQHDGRLADVVLLMHQQLSEPGQRGVRFQVQASWRGGL
jgi:hypothetical protein